MKKITSLLFRFLCLGALLIFCNQLQAQNPPYGTVLSGPTLNAGSYEFVIRADPSVLPDCGFYSFDCNDNGLGIENLQIYWGLRAFGNCADCNVDDVLVGFGILEYGFWGTASVLGSFDEGVDCATPGGTDRIISIPENLFCSGLDYELVIFAFNPDYNKGLPDGGTVGPGGPYRCCDGDPSIGSTVAMQAECTLPINGGTGAGWLNPSYPTEYAFNFVGAYVPPIFNVNTNLNDGDVVPCGYNLTSEFTIEPNTACVQSTIVYQIYVNGDIVTSEAASCISEEGTYNADFSFVTCPDDPTCTLPPELYQLPCGENTIRWEAFEDCPNAEVIFYEATFTVECPEADELTLTGNTVICAGDDISVAVTNPANVNIPYTGGSYEMHWDNNMPYTNPGTNYLGSGQTQVLTNDGTYTYNTPITVTGTVWENYSTVGPLGCESQAVSQSFVMLEPIEVNVLDQQACNFGGINISATGGMNAYDGSDFTYDATSAGVGTNTTGIFTDVTPGIYDIIVSDANGCSETVSVEVNAPIDIQFDPLDCANPNVMSILVTGGQPFNPAYNDPTAYQVQSNVNGIIGQLDASGQLTTTLTPGPHTITVKYDHLNPDGTLSGIDCSATIEFTAFTPLNIVANPDPCLFGGQAVIDLVEGGDNTTYTVFLSTTAAPGATNDVASTEGSLSGAGTLTGVAPGDYFAVVEDAQGCQTSVAVTVNDGSAATLVVGNQDCDANTVTVNTTGGLGTWTYYVITVGGTYSNPADQIVAPITGTSTGGNTSEGLFTNVPAGSYEVVAVNSDGCNEVAEPISTFDPISIEQLAFCGGGDIGVMASGGYTGANYTYNLIDGTSTVVSTNTTGVFSGFAPGTYTVEVNDNNPNVTGGCTETITLELFAAIDVTYSEDPCVGANGVEVSALSGGGGTEYTVVVSETSGSLTPATSATGMPLTFTSTNPTADFPYVFLDLIVGTDYYIVVSSGITDPSTGELCTSTFGPFNIPDAPELTFISADCENDFSVSMEATATTGPYDFYLYTLNQALQGAPSLPSTTYNATSATAGAATSSTGSPLAITGNSSNAITFSEVPTGYYTAYSLDASGCVVSTTVVQSYEPLTLEIAAGDCSTNTITVSTVYGGHDPDVFSDASNYSVFLSSQDAPNGAADITNNQGTLNGAGTFTNVQSGSFYAIVEDDRGCQYSVPVSIGGDISLTYTPACDTPTGSAQVSAVGGSADWDFYLYNPTGTFDVNNPTSAANGWVASDTGDGSGSDVAGDFSGITAGPYTAHAVDAGGCITQLTDVQVYDPLAITIDETACTFGSAAISSATGGTDPALFSNGTYTIFLSTVAAPGASNNVTTNEGTLSGAGIFTGVASGSYHAVLEDANGCQVSVPVTVDEGNLEAATTDDCTALAVQATGGTPTWTFYAYTTGGTFDAANPTNAGNGYVATSAGDGSGLGTFTGLSAGTYDVYGLDENGCQVALTGLDLNPDGLSISEDTGCEYGSVIVSATGGESPFTYTLLNSGGGTVDSNTTGTFAGVAAGTYTVNAVDANNCDGTTTVTVYDPIALVEPYNCYTGISATGGSSSSYTFELYDSATPPNLVASSITGIFPNSVAGGDYQLVIIDDAGCQLLTNVNCEPLPCDLDATASTTCESGDEFSVNVVITGSNTYTINDGMGGTLTGQSPGTINVGPFPNGEFNIEVINEDDLTCVIPLNGSENCFNCNLMATVTPECIDSEEFNLNILTSGNGTFVIDDGTTTYDNITSGALIGPFPSGPYNITITSEVDPTCVETFTGESDCSSCDLSLDYYTECIDNNNFLLVMTITGSDEYIVTDGTIVLSGYEAGVHEIPFIYDGTYMIEVYSETNPDCTQTILFNGSNCIECDLETSATTECAGIDGYNVIVTVSGSSNYIIDSGFGAPIFNQPAGVYTITGLNNGSYAVTVTDLSEPGCSFVLTGEEDCFDCELVASATTECVDINNIEATFTIAGNGTFTITDGTTVLSGISAGTETVSLPEGSYSFDVISEEDASCVETVTLEQDCVDCDLDATATTECVGVFNYNVIINLTGTSTYTIFDGTSALTGQTAGIINVGTFANGPYTITISDENNLACTKLLSGEADCFECDLAATATTECVDDFNYSVNINLTGSSTYTISDGVNPDLTGQTAGNIVVGPIPNGTYAITITDETEDTCNETLTGDKDCLECNLGVSYTTECVDFENFNVLLDITGTGTFSINDGTTTQTGISAGQQTLSFPNGNYTIVVNSELIADCSETISVTEDCFECDLNASAITECIDLETYNVIVTLTGSDTYTLVDGLGGALTGQAAGTFTFGPYPNGPYNITITSESDVTCNEALTGEKDCFECDLSVNYTTTCLDLESFELNISIAGSDTYTITDGTINLTGNTAGDRTITLLNGTYAIDVISETDGTCLETINVTEDCFECDLTASAVTECIDDFNYNVVVTLAGSDTYTIVDGIGGIFTNQTPGTYTYGPYPNGDYNITITSETDVTCNEALTGTKDCFECDLSVSYVADCIDLASFDLTITIAGSGTYTISNGPINLSGNPPGDRTITLLNGTYSIDITSETDPTCTETISVTQDCEECDLQASASTTCIDGQSYNVVVNLSGSDTYTINNGLGGIQTGQTAGNVTVGPFSNGDYNITVTSENVSDCEQVLTGSEDCLECDLQASASTACVDNFSYNVVVNLSGSDTYTINDGLGGIQTGQTAGNITVGPYPNGDYNITVTSENVADCEQVLTGSEDCLECDLQASASTACVDNFSYNVVVNLSGSDTYTINDGLGGIQTGQTAGNITVGPFPNGDYSITITSENVADCEQVLTGSEDCLECDLQASANTECIDNFTYNVIVNLSGSDTYTINDGLGGVQTGQSAGNITVGPYPNGNYNITITSENVDNCEQILTGTADCLECDLSVSATTQCIDGFNYNVVVSLAGSDTYTINDGLGGLQNGVAAGNITFGPYPNGSYNITVTSENVADCQQILTGNEDCFECDLTASATTECVDASTYNVLLTLSGTGTFTVNDGNNTLVAQTAGILNLGPYPNGNYSITITSEIDPTCVETVSGSKDCFECDLSVSAVTQCVDDFNFNVLLTLDGTGTFIVDDGINLPIAGQPSGSITFGPYPNGDYSITVTSQTDDTCFEVASGIEDCFECEINVNANTECVDAFNYNVNLNLTGPGTFTLDDGINPPLTGQVAGTISFGPYPNGDYSILITSETDDTCTETVSGSKDCFECDLSLNATNECIDQFTYNTVLTITGPGTFTVDDGINTPLTGQAAGLLTFGPYNNNDNYNILVTSETDDTCFETATGTNDCFECDLQINTSPVCIDAFTYNVTLTIAGSGTFTVDDGINSPLTGQTSGNITIGPLDNGLNTITVTSEEDSNCVEIANINENCFECGLEANAVTECIDDFNYNVVVTFAGEGTYTLVDGGGETLANQSAGTATFGPYENGGYSIAITSDLETNCFEILSGTEDCFDCTLQASATTECIDDFTYNVILTFEGEGTYIIDDGMNPALVGQVSSTVTMGPFDNGNYNITITSETDPTCTETVSGTKDCFECDFTANAITECIDAENYNVTLTLAGEGTYSIDDGINLPLTGQTAGDIPLGTFTNGDYSIVVTSEVNADCFETISGSNDCFECDLEISTTTACTSLEGYDASIVINGTGTYSITEGDAVYALDFVGGETFNWPFTNGPHTIIITSNIDPTCTETITVEDDCLVCTLEASATTECEEGTGDFMVTVVIAGEGVYTLDDGINDPQTGFTAGTYTVGPYPSGLYNIQITDPEIEDCEASLSDAVECFVCEVVGNTSTTCVDAGNYNLIYQFSGNGTYTIDNGDGTPLTGVTAGAVLIGTYPNGTYSFTVTSEIDETCTFDYNGENDCFECDLVAAAFTECNDLETYNVILEVSGQGTFTIDTGIEVLTDQTAGSFNFGPFASGADYNINIISDFEDTCIEVFTGSEECFECELPTNANSVCIDEDSYQISFVIGGNGTYTVDDGIDPPQVGVEPGTVVLGPYENGGYDVVITSEFDPTCTSTVSGDNDCFVCDLQVSATTECVNENLYIIYVNLQGTGLFSVQGGDFDPLFGQSAGIIELGPISAENSPYTITVTSELEEECQAVINSAVDCTVPFECDLQVGATTTCADDGDGYYVVVNLNGSGSYSIESDNSDLVLFDQTAGTIDYGPIENGSYSLTITSDQEEDCELSLSGTQDCSEEPECDLGAVTSINCIGVSEYEVVLTLSGSGVFTLDDGVNDPLTGQTAGEIILGPLPNGDFSIDIQQVGNPECATTVSGTGVCSFDCELTINSDIVCAPDSTSYNVVLEIIGEDSYSIVDGVSEPITGVSGGTIVLGPYPDGDYSISVTNETNSFCNQGISGNFFCSQTQVCDLEVDLEPYCDDGVLYIVMTLQGSGVYTIYDGFSGELNGATAGTYEFDMGTSTVFELYEIVDEDNPDCNVTLELGNGCDGNCDLEVYYEVECLPNGDYNLIVELVGTGTYDIQAQSSFFDQQQINDVGAGFYTIEGLVNDDFDLFVDQNGPGLCQADIEGNGDCEPFNDCDLGINLVTSCLADGQFMITAFIEGSALYTIDDGTGTLIEDVPAGEYELGPYEADAYFFQIYDANNTFFDCIATSLISFGGCDDFCAFDIAYETICTGPDTYFINLTINDNDSGGNYDINDGFFTFIEDVPAGEYELGPYTEDFFFFVVVSIADEPDCFQDFFGNSNCTDNQACDLSASIEPVCLDDGSGFEITLSITGTGLYSFDYGDGSEDGLAAGDYTFGPFENGAYNIEIKDETQTSCFQSFEGSYFCEPPPPCDLAASAAPVCSDEGTFTLAVDISGTSVYSIYQDDIPLVTGISAIELEVGNYPSGSEYEIKIVDDNNSACFQYVSGVFSCGILPVCDLVVTPIVQCEGNDYNLLVELTGSSTYTIIVNGIALEGQTEGSIGLGPFSGDVYDVEVFDENDDQCTQAVSGLASCGETPLCDLNANLTIECIGNDEYIVTLELEGSSTYDIYDGLEVGFPDFTDLLIEDITATDSPVSVGPFDNGTFRVLVIDPENTDCFVDFIGFRDCENPEVCDLNASVQTLCNDDDTFDVLVSVEGSSTYWVRLFDSWGGPEIDELVGVNGGETVQLGAVTSGEYYIFIQDEEFGPCDQDFRGTVSCSEGGNPCDLVTNSQVVCVDDGTFFVVVTIEGDEIYDIETGFGGPGGGGDVNNVEAGTYELGPFFEFFGGFYNFTVESDQSDCFSTTSGTINCSDPPLGCDLQASVEIDCVEGDTYNLVLTIEGSGTYFVESNVSNQDGLTAGEYTIGPLSLNTYEIFIEEEGNDGCFQNLSGTESCEEPDPNCDLVLDPIIDCIDENSFNITIDIAGSDTYIVDDGNGNVLTGQSAGDLDLGEFPNGGYSITVTSEASPNCIRSVAGNNNCSDPPVACDLQVSAGSACETEDSYELIIIIEGSSTYCIDLGDGSDPICGQTAGDISVGSLPNGFFEATVTDEDSPDCFQSISGFEDCSNPFICTLEVNSTTNCLADGTTYNVVLDITGEGNYTIETGLGEDLTGQTAGTVTVGPYPNGPYNIVVTHEEEATCFQELSGINICEEPTVCDLLASAATECINTDTYNVLVELAGSSTYTIDDGINEPLTAQTAGTIAVGPIPNGTYGVTITDETNGACFQLLEGAGACAVPVECDLLAEVSTECISEEGFDVILEITGTGVYCVDFAIDAAPICDYIEGTYNIRTYGNGNYFFQVYEADSEECQQQFFGSQNCAPPAECDLEAGGLALCDPSSEGYVVSLTIQGSSTYRIDDGVNFVITGVNGGAVITELIPNGDYEIVITDETNPACSQTLEGTQDCENPISCPLLVIPSTECADEDGYMLSLNIAGNPEVTYCVDLGNGEDPICGLEIGEEEFGPLPNGDYEVSVYDETNPECLQTLSGTQSCSVPVSCDLQASGLATCEEDGTGFIISITIVGTSSYTIEDGVNEPITSVTAGVVDTEMLPNGDYEIVITDNNNPTCTQTLAGTQVCTPPTECTLLVIPAAICEDDETYTLSIEVTTTSGSSYCIDLGNDEDPICGLTDSDYEIGTFPNGDYEINVYEEDNPTCSQTISGSQNCSEPICDLQAGGIAVCNADNDGYVVELVIVGASVYTVDDGVNDPIGGITAGNLITDFIPNGNYEIVITDENNPGCSQVLSGSQNCAEPVICTLTVLPITACIDEGNYLLSLDIGGSEDATYCIDAGTEDPICGSIGIVEVGTFSNGNYQVIVYEQDNPGCSQTITGLQDCSTPPVGCDAQLNIISTACVNTDSYNVIVEVLGGGSYTIDDGINDEITDVTAGEITVGPIPNGSYFITLTDQANPGCIQSRGGNASCDEVFVCDLEASAQPICLTAADYSVVIDLTGSSTYTIDDGNGNLLEGQVAGEVVLGPFPNGAYTISIVDEAEEACFQNISGTWNCAGPCDLAAIPEPVCLNNAFYEIELTISGSSTYTIDDGINSPLESQTAGTIILGPIPNGFYEVSIIDDANPDCALVLFGQQNCNPGCDIVADATSTCTENGEYEVTITFEGSSIYTIDDGIHEPLTGQTTNSLILGPFVSGVYSITIQDENNASCLTNIQGEQNCLAALESGIGLFVFLDMNEDGIFDEAEDGLEGVEVTLYSLDNEVVDVTTTDSNGEFLFPNVPPAEYYLAFDIPSGYIVSPQNEGNDETLDSDIDEVGKTEVFVLADGEVVLDYGAGVYPDPVCEGLFANITEVCEGGEGLLGVVIVEGTPPYIIDGGDLYFAEVGPDDFPLDYIGPIPNGSTYSFVITDANGCPAGEFAGEFNCETVPVELISFSGQVLVDGNQLKWVTASEYNNDHFKLMHSIDGTNFNPIAIVEGAGTSSSSNNYAHLHKEAPNGLSYYRLDQFDYDGSMTQSNIITLIRGELVFGINDIHPVPSSDFVEVNFSTDLQTIQVQVTIYDVIGRVVAVQDIPVINGNNTHRLDIRNYAAGTYIISLNNGNSIVSSKFVKE